jgi:hypothetical protein
MRAATFSDLDFTCMANQERVCVHVVVSAISNIGACCRLLSHRTVTQQVITILGPRNRKCPRKPCTLLSLTLTYPLDLRTDMHDRRHSLSRAGWVIYVSEPVAQERSKWLKNNAFRIYDAAHAGEPSA